MEAVLVADVDHASLSMLLAVNRLLDALHVEGRFRRTCVIQLVLLADVFHSFRCMLLAVNRLLAAIHIEARLPRA